MADEEAAALKIQALHRGNQGRQRAEDRVDQIMSEEMEQAAVKIQSIARGQSARKRTEEKMEVLMEQELERNALKIQSVVRGRSGRKKAETRMEELMEAEMECAATSVQAVFRGHQARKEAYTLMSADMERRMNETAERIGTYNKKSPGGSGGKRNDLVSHVLRLQERVKEIQHIVKSVVPVFSGDESPSPSISPTPSPVKAARAAPSRSATGSATVKRTTNGKSMNQLSVAIVGLDGIGSHCAQMFVRAGVGKVILIDSGSVEESHVKHLIYSAQHVGKLRTDAAEEVLASAVVATHSINAAAEGEMAPLLKDMDVVIDSTMNEEACPVLSKICAEQSCCRVQCGVSGLAAYFEIFPKGKSHQPVEWPPNDTAVGDFDWLVSSTISTCAGHMVQNTLKHLLDTGSVVGSMKCQGLSSNLETTSLQA